jgi:hypothetical protein
MRVLALLSPSYTFISQKSQLTCKKKCVQNTHQFPCTVYFFIAVFALFTQIRVRKERFNRNFRTSFSHNIFNWENLPNPPPTKISEKSIHPTVYPDIIIVLYQILSIKCPKTKKRKFYAPIKSKRLQINFMNHKFEE